MKKITHIYITTDKTALPPPFPTHMFTPPPFQCPAMYITLIFKGFQILSCFY